MAEAGSNGQQAAAPSGPPPNLSVMAQYVKDLSFESPGAPDTLKPRQASPQINISIGVEPKDAGQERIEVELKIDARGSDGDTVLFVIELVYAGLFRLVNIPPDDVAPVTLIECPRLLFPFARQVVAEASRNGGFPPLLIDPIDFVSLYRQRVAAQQQGGQPQGAQPPPGAA